MEILHRTFKSGKGIYAKSKPVNGSNWAVAKSKALEMMKWMDDMQGRFLGIYHEAWALSHCQVEDEPLAFFVVDKQFIGKDDFKTNHINFFWKNRLIFNPVLLEAPEFFEVQLPKREVTRTAHNAVEVETKLENAKKPNIYTPSIKDACISFPDRKGKFMKRYFRIKVSYDIIGVLGSRKHVEEWIEGVKAHIFQHELEHSLGMDMYHV